MLIRAFIVLTFLAAFASFGYGFWLVLAPEGHSWRVDIPLDDHDRQADGDARDAATPVQAVALATSSGGSSSAAASAAPGVEVTPLKVSETPPPRPAAAAAAPPITLSLPIACEPGIDCWIVNYVDVDPSDSRQDYRCGQMSYDGHKGTDIGLANESRIDEAVPVLAAAAGTVVGTRDGEPDAGAGGIEQARAAGKECGNGVRIDHGDGWATQYCHMRKDSVLVTQGQAVEVGQTLGAVGLSGMTQFPHVHLSVVHNGEVVDPFRGVAGGETCGLGTQPLWDAATLRDLTALQAPVLLDAAFFDAVPDNKLAAAGKAVRTTLAPDAGAVVVWFRAAGVAPGDTGEVMITAPDGSVVIDETVAFDRHQAEVFRAFGIRNSTSRFPDGLPTGQWTGRAVVKRDSHKTGEQTVKINVAAPG
ncbi:MAG: M23 family metallopeptidase [Thalassobaculaceae bacterium]|nr:M23 family metallopeptidase [Thalassobaculaceae bacterium]